MLSAVASGAKTLIPGSELPESYTIYASSYFSSYAAPETDGNYFVALPFRKDGDVWNSSPVVFWPVGGRLDFMAIACESDSLNIGGSAEWYEEDCSKGVELAIEDGECQLSEILFASSYGRISADGCVPLRFSHAQSWLQFVIDTDTDILRIDSVVVEKVYAGGLFRISSNIYMDAEWDFRGHRRKDRLVPGTVGLIPHPGTPELCNLLVPEQDACDMAIHYSVRSSTSSDWGTARSSIYRHKAGADPWFYGGRNVFHIGFSFSDIVVTSSVKGWNEDSYCINLKI